MSEHELNQYLDWQDKCYEEDTCPPPHLQTADKIFNRMIALDRNPNSAYLEIEPAQIRIILNSLVSEDEAKTKRYEKQRFVCILFARGDIDLEARDSILEWLDKERE